MDKNSPKSECLPGPYCGSAQILQNGSTHRKKNKFLCQDCHRQFFENPQNKSISTELKNLIQKLLIERISLGEIALSVGVSICYLCSKILTAEQGFQPKKSLFM